MPRRPLLLLLVVLAGTACLGLIDVKRTPATLVKEAEWIVHVRLTLGDADDELLVERLGVLKGEPPAIARLRCPDLVTLVAKGADPDLLIWVTEALDNGGIEATIFRGNFAGADGGQEGAEPQPARTLGALHVGSFWFGIMSRDDGWHLVPDTVDLAAVWDGGDEPLRALVAKILDDPRTTVPTAAGFSWKQDPVSLGRSGGPVSQLVPVRLAGRDLLLCLAPTGDRVYGLGDGGPEDLTRAWRLDTASSVGIPLPLDGTPALLLWGAAGGRLVIPEGDTTRTVRLQSDLAGVEALDLLTMFGVARVAALHAGGLALLDITGTGLVAHQDLPVQDGKVTGLLAVDLDGDGHGDLVTAGAKQLTLYRGTPEGLAAPVKLGRARTVYHRLLPADFDLDGDLDLLLVGPAGLDLWIQGGDGRLVSLLHEAGELGYHSHGGRLKLAGAAVGDFNGDSLPDVVLAPPTAFPQVFYNRGGRSFGYARSLNAGEGESLAALHRPKAAIAVADVDGDGHLDAVVADADGTLHALEGSAPTRPVTLGVELPPGLAGPLTLRARTRGRSLGAHQVVFGRPVSIVAPHPAAIGLRWGEAGRARSAPLLASTTMVLEP